MAEVQNLCLSLDQARKASMTLKLYLSQRGVLSSCYESPVESRETQSHDRTRETITLDQVLLQRPDIGSSSVIWSPIQRMVLSFNLASSLLQLCSTPWMAESWSKQSIHFWGQRSSSTADEAAFLVDTSHPFIVHIFGVAPTARPTHKLDARHQLLNLGILLLEIGHEKRFESWTSARGLTLSKAYGTQFHAAQGWLRDSVGELLPSYYDAAARCIECTFQTRSAKPAWDDLDFRRSVCELVIKLLWSNCFTTDI